MTTGSAASLPAPGPEAPLPVIRSLRRNGPLPAVASLDTTGAPHRGFPRIALADDPPRGRILVVTDQASLALDVQRALRDAGYRAVGPAETIEEAERLVDRRPIDGAVVDLELAGGAASVLDKLGHAGIPFVQLTDGPAGSGSAKEALVVGKPVSGRELIDALERALSQSRRPGGSDFYPVPPPYEVWPRVFPQL